MKNKTFSNILIIISAAVTFVSFIYPQILEYGMNDMYIQNKDYVGIAVQFLMYQFLHGGILHLLSNGLFLYIFGNQVESMIGTRRYVIFFILSTLFIGICILLFTSGNTIGISGFAMAILGYYAMVLKKINHPEYRGAIFLLAINIGIGFTGNISLVGHLFGAIFGLLFFYGSRLYFKKI
ncbi:MAG: rhomboid family intramembrane serine protease [Candidatus Gracilibacteria bacterium]|nr:rhomboid family intramembrane serine protease [Candidatus Gracilibacteria bacterium]